MPINKYILIIMTEKILIGTVGQKCGGKETFAKLLQECLPNTKIVNIRSSSVLATTLTQWGLPLTRHNLQKMAMIMNANFGDGTLTRAVQKLILATEADIIIFDGARWESDAAMIRSFPNNRLVYITADINIRYQRSKKRSEKADETSATFEDFEKEEQVLTELNIAKIGATADMKIVNEGSVAEFKQQIQEFCEKHLVCHKTI